MPNFILLVRRSSRLCHPRIYTILLWRSLLILSGTVLGSLGLEQPAQAAQAEPTALSFELSAAPRIEPQRLSSLGPANRGGIVSSYAAGPRSRGASQDWKAEVATFASGALNGVDPIPALWWEQGSDSPIAVAIGNAEGTRQPDGAKTAAYYWHADPGNGADNFGTFSYQHFSLARTRAVRAEETAIAKRQTAAAQLLPELADQAQMQRLRGFYQQLQHQAQTNGLVLTPLEVLNGLDLINQSEAAGLSPGGYIDHLAELRGLDEDAEEQIKEARSWSYWHPDRKAWDAPGLGNSYSYVRRDQERRFEAVKQAAETYVPNGKVWVAQGSQLPGASSNEAMTAAQNTRAQDQGKQTLRQAVASAVQTDSLSFELGRKIALAAVGR